MIHRLLTKRARTRHSALPLAPTRIARRAAQVCVGDEDCPGAQVSYDEAASLMRTILGFV